MRHGLTGDQAASLSMNPTKESVLCNLCGSDDFLLKFVGKDRLLNIPGEFSVVECNVCGLVYVNPRPTKESLKKYYPQTKESLIKYYPQTNSNSNVPGRPLTQAVLRLHKMLVEAVSYKISIPELKNGTLLDIGCGTGSYLASMKQLGWDAYGVELSSAACEVARRNTGLAVFHGTVDEASFPNEFFDVVTMHQVLEHTQNPAETLSEIHRILKADGLVAMSVPDAESWESKIFGPAWVAWELPRHLYHFSRATITAMLEKKGFSVIAVKHDAHPGGVLGSMRYVFADVKLNPRIGFALAYPLSFLLAAILSKLNTSGSMAIYAGVGGITNSNSSRTVVTELGDSTNQIGRQASRAHNSIKVCTEKASSLKGKRVN